MSRDEFVMNVEIAAGSLSITASSDDRHADASEMTRQLQNSDLWLTPKSVAAFTPADFVDLPAIEQTRLNKAVSGFLAIASNVPSDGPATKDESRRGRNELETIIDVLTKNRCWR